MELLPGVEGLCHRSEMASEANRRRSQTPGEETTLPIGEEFEFKIIKIDETQKRIGLSLRAIADDEERIRLEDYRRQAAAATSTVGDLLKQHRSDETSL